MDSKRDFALDLVKGACVLVMVVHHSLNYFPSDYVALKYFRFVSGAFPFLAGYVATHLYSQKYDPLRNSRVIAGRLVLRGLKLLVVFSVANLAIAALFRQRMEGLGRGWGECLSRAFVWGDYRDVSFSLLVPISYTLISTGIAVLLLKGRLRPLAPLACILVAYCSAVHYDQASGYYLSYLSIGLLGAACGLIPHERLAKASGNLSGVVSLLSFYVLFISFTPLCYPLYVAYVVLAVLGMYSVAAKTAPGEVASRKIMLLGKYSLLSYLFQILALRLLLSVVPRWGLGKWDVLVACLITCVATVGCAETVHWARGRWTFADRSYRLVFA